MTTNAKTRKPNAATPTLDQGAGHPDAEARDQAGTDYRDAPPARWRDGLGERVLLTRI